jgi:hypothetical protein
MCHYDMANAMRVHTQERADNKYGCGSRDRDEDDEEVASTKRTMTSRQHFWARRVSEGSDLDAKPDIS